VGKGDFLDPKTFQNSTPTLGVGSTTTPPDRGDFINAISLTAGDPDRAQALTGFQVATPTIGPVSGSWLPPTAHGDVGDSLGSSKNTDTGTGVYALIAFTTATPTLGVGSHAAPGGHGDIGDVGAASELPGIQNDTSAGPSSLITWDVTTPTLGVGSTLAPKQHGDLGEIYGTLGSAVEGLTWEVVTPSLTVGVVAPVTGHGDISDPFAWEDVVLYLTSQPYPVVTVENYTPGLLITSGFFQPDLITEHENFTLGLAITGGNIHLALIIYSNYPPENYTTGLLLTGGSLTITTGYVIYSNWPPENYTLGLAITGGSLTVTTGYIIYNNWPPENYTLGLAITGGSLA
jgi:hypothetical protein